MSRQRVTLHIDRIVIDGPHMSRAALTDAISAELQRALAVPGALDALKGAGYVPRVNAGEVRPANAGPAGLGAAIANATMGALKR
jgi:hypothetical protein